MPKLLDDDEDFEEFSFLQASQSGNSSKCAVKCKTECAAGNKDAAQQQEDVDDVAEPIVSDVDSLRANAAAARAGSNKMALGRPCLNHCGGLCRTLCAKFKVLKVCNGCVRGCFKRCSVGGPQKPAETAEPSVVSLIQEDVKHNIDLNH